VIPRSSRRRPGQGHIEHERLFAAVADAIDGLFDGVLGPLLEQRLEPTSSVRRRDRARQHHASPHALLWPRAARAAVRFDHEFVGFEVTDRRSAGGVAAWLGGDESRGVHALEQVGDFKLGYRVADVYRQIVHAVSPSRRSENVQETFCRHRGGDGHTHLGAPVQARRGC